MKLLGKAKSYLLVVSIACLVACEPEIDAKLEPDVHASNLPVKLKTWVKSDGSSSIMVEFSLGPKSGNHFITLLSEVPVHTSISEMPADPIGYFYVGETEYIWHGNAVIRGEGKYERLWHGRYLQSLINAIYRGGFEDPTEETLREILSELEQNPPMVDVQLEGPGAYPGGGDALHPVGMDDLSP